jgi:hypothetical protein
MLGAKNLCLKELHVQKWHGLQQDRQVQEHVECKRVQWKFGVGDYPM